MVGHRVYEDGRVGTEGQGLTRNLGRGLGMRLSVVETMKWQAEGQARP